MPRFARAVFAGLLHHVTQRGNPHLREDREPVFFGDDDRHTNLAWLRECCGNHGVAILAYCLMTNHVHLVAVPATADGLERALKPLHMRYAQRVNRARGWHGHLWQGRFFSSPLDDDYLWAVLRYVELWAVLRYVERNPVRAGPAHRVGVISLVVTRKYDNVYA